MEHNRIKRFNENSELNISDVMSNFLTKLQSRLRELENEKTWDEWDDGVNFGRKDMIEEIMKMIEELNISDIISSKNYLTKDEIISTGDWYDADYINLMEGYFWKHKNIEEDGYVFYMRRYKNDGFTTIIEQDKSTLLTLELDDNKLFEGYIKNIEELKQIVHLCRLHEI